MCAVGKRMVQSSLLSSRLHPSGHSPTLRANASVQDPRPLQVVLPEPGPFPLPTSQFLGSNHDNFAMFTRRPAQTPRGLELTAKRGSEAHPQRVACRWYNARQGSTMVGVASAAAVELRNGRPDLYPEAEHSWYRLEMAKLTAPLLCCDCHRRLQPDGLHKACACSRACLN